MPRLQLGQKTRYEVARHQFPSAFLCEGWPAQPDIAFRIMADEPSLFVTKTVVLELFWVLSKSPAYKLSAEIVHAAIRHLISMLNVMVEDYDTVDRALEWSGRGLKFPDALHLAASQNFSHLTASGLRVLFQNWKVW